MYPNYVKLQLVCAIKSKIKINAHDNVILELFINTLAYFMIAFNDVISDSLTVDISK
jgi:hypothetical protein